jgi:hypothetical protein
VRALRRLAWVGWATVPLGQANSVGPWAEMLAQYYAAIFLFLFFIKYFRNSYKLQKCVENTILLGKI